MNTSDNEHLPPEPTAARVTADTLTVDLADGADGRGPDRLVSAAGGRDAAGVGERRTNPFRRALAGP